MRVCAVDSGVDSKKMKTKGMASLTTLIGLLVFLLVLIIAAVPIISASINTTSASTNLVGTNIFTISAITPLFLVLGGLVTIVWVMFQGA